MICSSSNLLGMQKARGALKNKNYKLKIFAEKNLKKIKTSKELVSIKKQTKFVNQYL